jgi:Plant transposon protein
MVIQLMQGELVCVSESLASESLIRFCRAVQKKFEPDYLRQQNKDELREIEQQHARMGFPGCIRCVDVASWTWDKCPVGWKWQYTVKEKGRVIDCKLCVTTSSGSGT